MAPPGARGDVLEHQPGVGDAVDHEEEVLRGHVGPDAPSACARASSDASPAWAASKSVRQLRRGRAGRCRSRRRSSDRRSALRRPSRAAAGTQLRRRGLARASSTAATSCAPRCRSSATSRSSFVREATEDRRRRRRPARSAISATRRVDPLLGEDLARGLEDAREVALGVRAQLRWVATVIARVPAPRSGIDLRDVARPDEHRDHDDGCDEQRGARRRTRRGNPSSERPHGLSRCPGGATCETPRESRAPRARARRRSAATC